MDRGAWWAVVHGVANAAHNWVANTHILIIICLNVAIFGFLLYGMLSTFSTQISISFLDFGKFSAIIFFKCIFDPPFCFLSFWDSYYVYWDLSHKSHISLSFFFHLFFYLLFWLCDFFVILSCRSLILMHHPVYYLSPSAEVLSLQMSFLILIDTSIFSTSCSSSSFFLTVIYISIDSLS